MREGIHPEYSEIRASCSCGNVILIKSTLKEEKSNIYNVDNSKKNIYKAKYYLSKKELKYPKKEYFYKLSVGFDTKSFLVSLMNTINPKRQYKDKYAHRASQSTTMNKSFINIANILKKKFKPKISLEIGSNDGVFIKNFNKKKVIAVEPCKNLSKITKMNGFKTYSEFWTQKLARKILNSYKSIDLFFSANTISHIPNLKETLQQLYYLRKKTKIL